MCTISFKERVKNAAIENAFLYKDIFIKYEYLVCSKAFEQGYHIIKADKGNYLHLIGIHTNLTPDDFFDKCVADGERQLTEADFDFDKPGKDEKSVKGSVREKIVVLPNMINMFQYKLFAEDKFKKNKVACAFATTDNVFTLGFVAAGRPKSLLKGNALDKSKQKEVDLIFRKERSSSSRYEELVYGDKQSINKYKKFIEDLVSVDLYSEQISEGFKENTGEGLNLLGY